MKKQNVTASLRHTVTPLAVQSANAPFFYARTWFSELQKYTYFYSLAENEKMQMVRGAQWN